MNHQPGTDPVIDSLLMAIKRDWTRIDEAWNRARRPADIHLRRDTALDEESFLRDALLLAAARGIRAAFIRELICEDLLAEADLERVSELPDGPSWVLHTFQNAEYLPVDAVLYGKNLLAACDRLCRIDIDDVHVGTGVQVSGTLVATAAHVIRPLAEADPGAPGQLRAKPGSRGKLALMFGYAEDFDDVMHRHTKRNPGEVAFLHQDWLAWVSPCAHSDLPASGLDIADTAGITDKDGPWDLALIRLAVPRLTTRPPVAIGEQEPGTPSPINILHHPNGGTAGGQPLLLSEGRLRQMIGAPAVRCLHDANTAEGSSGAPVFDRRWRMVAMHQGGGLHGHAWAGYNRAVPAWCWRDHVTAAERHKADQVPYLRELKTSTDLPLYPYPVIGRRETQRRIWRGMRPSAGRQHRLLVVRGDPGTGRRFTKMLVREMVMGQPNGVVAALDMANTLNDSVAGFGGRIAGALSAQLRLPDPVPLTTGPRAVHDDVVPVLCALLEEVAD